MNKKNAFLGFSFLLIIMLFFFFQNNIAGFFGFNIMDYPADVFVSVWNTSYDSPDNQITLPLVSNGEYHFSVDWGDGNISQVTSWDSLNKTHVYSTPGVYEVQINGTIIGFSFNNAGDRLKIIQIKQQGNLNLGNNGGYFYGTSGLREVGFLRVERSDLQKFNLGRRNLQGFGAL